jgi:DNA (cytosine-5)-methyltransferase 1
LTPPASTKRTPEFYEFFSGGGMARLGLGNRWRCRFANDIDKKKAENYRRAFDGGSELRLGDIGQITAAELPGEAELAWASFPCQDLSLAGLGSGLKGKRSGLFWEFWRIVKELGQEGRAPRAVILENVYGTITSHGGRDLAAICEALAAEGYCYAPMVVDAALFLPQSRPRLFVVGFRKEAPPPPERVNAAPVAPWHPEKLALAYDRLTPAARQKWLWLSLPQPTRRRRKLIELIEEEPTGVAWHTGEETARLIGLMSPLNLEKLRSVQRGGKKAVGTLYRRTRTEAGGLKRQRAEVRFDDTAGCLRTPAGGSSRQIVVWVEGEKIRSRLLSPREAARLMGIPDTYPLPGRYNDAYHLAGDGVAVPVVGWIAKSLIEPALGL